MEIREVAKSAAKEKGYPDGKLERLDVVETFVNGRDVFAVLPLATGRVRPHAQIQNSASFFFQ